MTIRMRGRNGSFEFDSIRISGGLGDEKIVFVDFLSKRVGREAPAYLFGPKPEVVDLLEDILSQVRAAGEGA